MKKCLFCGSEENFSNEHVFASWLLNHIGASKEPKPFKRVKFYGAVVSERNHSYYNIQNGNICKSCNNGWMSELENYIKDEYSVLFEPYGYNKLTLERIPQLIDDKKFKMWIIKIILLYNSSTDINDFATEKLYRKVYKGKLPKNIFIRIGFSNVLPDTPLKTIQGLLTYFTTSVHNKNRQEVLDHGKSFSSTLQFNKFLINVTYIETNYEIILERFSGLMIEPYYGLYEGEKTIYNEADCIHEFHHGFLPYIHNPDDN